MHYFLKFISGVKPLLASCQQNLYDIYHCRVYSKELLMMGRETVRNIQSFTSKRNLRN